jgi:hypothetical protein
MLRFFEVIKDIIGIRTKVCIDCQHCSYVEKGNGKGMGWQCSVSKNYIRNPGSCRACEKYFMVRGKV